VDAQLHDAILVDPKLPGVELDDAKLDGAQCSAKTGWPAGFDWKKAGATVEE
jgi:hypothetical protein